MSGPKRRVSVKGAHAWWLLVVLVGMCAPVARSQSSGAPRSETGVAILDPGPLRLVAGTPLKVEVLNGSPNAQALRLTVGREARRFVTVTPATTSREAGRTAIFTVILGSAPKLAPAVVLRATSTDGTLATVPLAIGPPDPSAALKLRAGYPASVDLGVVGTGDAPSAEVENLPGEASPSGQVGHLSGNGGTVPVTRDGNKLSVSSLPEPGTYSGTIDLAPGVDGGEVKITASARDGLAGAIWMLILGLVVAVISEAFLRRFRPQWALKRSLDALKKRVGQWQDDAATDFEALRAAAAGRPWSPPLLFVADDDASFLMGRAHEITESLKGAPSDGQRDRWGPDGAKMTGLEDKAADYHGLLENLRTVARRWLAFAAIANADADGVAHNPLGEHIDARLTGEILREGRLEHEIKEAADLTDQIDDLATLYEGLLELESQAVARHLDDKLAEEVRKTRGQLVATYTGADDQERFAARVARLADQIIGGQKPEQPARSAGAVARRPTTRGTVSLARALQATSAVVPVASPRPRPLTYDKGLGSRLKRNISAADIAFFFFSGVVVIATGLSALYYDADTWGTCGDYLAMFVWGSTGVAALTFAKNVLPGAVGGK